MLVISEGNTFTEQQTPLVLVSANSGREYECEDMFWALSPQLVPKSQSCVAPARKWKAEDGSFFICFCCIITTMCSVAGLSSKM